MSLKIHLMDTIDPMRPGWTVAARCGQMVEKAQPAFMWDFVAMTQKLDVRTLPHLCTKCRKLVEQNGFLAGKNYIYGIVAEKEYALLIQDGDLQG